MIKKTLILFALTGTALWASTPAELLQNNCASCHLLTTPSPDQIPTLKAPAMEAVMLHVKMVYKDKKSAREFIVDYTQNPDKTKSVCESNKVAGFGVMPSIKGQVDPKDIATISDYLYDNYPTPKFSAMIKEMLTNGKLNALKSSPFLLNGDNFPHLTKILIQNWDKIGLTKEQQEKLLVIRKETLSGVKAIKQKLAPLEEQVVEMAVDGEDPAKVKPILEEMAKLKVEATLIQYKCLTGSIAILSDEQLEKLLPFWDS